MYKRFSSIFACNPFSRTFRFRRVCAQSNDSKSRFVVRRIIIIIVAVAAAAAAAVDLFSRALLIIGV